LKFYTKTLRYNQSTPVAFCQKWEDTLAMTYCVHDSFSQQPVLTDIVLDFSFLQSDPKSASNFVKSTNFPNSFTVQKKKFTTIATQYIPPHPKYLLYLVELLICSNMMQTWKK